MLPTRLRGATLHNLKGVDLDVRPGEVLVLTGVSGSGKSSLALDTLYAEGQRRFVESFSPYARQFLERLERPPMKSLEPVGAGVAVDRSAPIKSSRSTVATMADLEPYLAGLFAKESIPHCPEHGAPAVDLDLGGAVARVAERFSGRQVLVTAPHDVTGKEAFLELREGFVRDGYRRVVVQGKLFELDELKPSQAEKAKRVDLVLDRTKVEPARASRLREALELAFRRSGRAFVYADEESLELCLGLSCPECARSLHPPRPGYFSYDSPLGACDQCRGFGRTLGIDFDKVIPDPRLSLAQGAVRPWRGEATAWERKQLKKFCEEEGIPFDAPWEKLTQAQKNQILSGSGKKKRTEYWGVKGWFSWLETKTYKMHVRVFLSRFRSYDPCPSCGGTRLNAAARSYKFGELDLSEWHALEVDEVRARLATLPVQSAHGALLSQELSSRLTYLSRVGLGYLSLDRQARTLSGGEAQRVTLTAALGTSLHNALFVLDEPTVGLHPADVAPLTELIAELAARDNAVVVIEHEPLVIERADRVVELGPRAGEHGGELVFDGTVAQAKKAAGATARALVGPRLSPGDPRPATAWLGVRGASEHNLKGVDCTIPLERLVAVSGPSGSGKSTLVVDVLYRALARGLGVSDVDAPGAHEALTGAEAIREVELVDQSPLGRTSRGNPATYTKAWDFVRKVFAAEPQAELQGLTPSHFSFNVAGGRCEACSGEGHETVEMQFLADVSLVCPVCSGRRFKDEVLTVRHRGLTIAEVLELTVDETLRVFSDSPALRRALSPLASLGLGYMRLGQPLSTLSGGEAQRLKLARALTAPKPGTLYVLDEPSAGLHADEIELVVQALGVLVRAGGSVVFVDHDLALLGAADWILELGPGGGKAGGELVFAGTPSELAKTDTKTGRALAAATQKSRAPRVAEKKRAAGKSERALTVQGAREHTLKGVDVTIPHEKLTVVTGPSGSGKSTLAFDVIFAEGQRRFLETLTPYARRFLPTMPRPHVDVVDGVPPSIALEQRTTRVGSRSTVATVTEVAHYLRLAFAKLGVPHCPTHDLPIGRVTPEELLGLARATKGRGELRAPVVRARKGTYLDVFSSAARGGIPWAVADGHRVQTDTPPRLQKTKEHSIDLILQEDLKFSELDSESLEKALRWGRGQIVLQSKEGERVLSTGGACSACGFSAGDIDPRFFSFNTAQGQCPTCLGAGVVEKTARRGKSAPDVAECPDCKGTRLAPFPRKVELLGETYPEIVALSVKELARLVKQWKFPTRLAPLATPLLTELSRRLDFLAEVGLDYLSLDRDAATLSGGELQRLRLAAQLGAGLTGALYVLDEPTIGLHPRDTGRLIGNLRKLVDTGSTVILVEHDEEAIRAADWLVDLGPGGGSQGGRILASGKPEAVLRHKDSPTAHALRVGVRPRAPRPVDPKGAFLTLDGATQHNLRGDKVRFPVGRLTVVAGVSGSGKSTLVRGVLLPALQKKLERVGIAPGSYKSLTGTESIKRALAVDQSPIGRTPRSVPATFLGIFDEIRQIFARSPDAQVRGFSAARFSFNTPQGGRCTTCDGQGVLSHEMSFLPDVVTTCPSCEGLRFEERTLEVKYWGRSIGEVLQLSAAEATEVFAAHPRLRAPLQVLTELGAGYLTLGQGSHTLSGGEAQRLKLAAELTAGSRHEPTLYVLDEPTTGLHLADVERLLGVLDRLVERGDTLVVIEHHPDVIRSADWIVELGPEGGPDGGRLVAEGTIGDVKKRKTATAGILRG